MPNAVHDRNTRIPKEQPAIIYLVRSMGTSVHCWLRRALRGTKSAIYMVPIGFSMLLLVLCSTYHVMNLKHGRHVLTLYNANLCLTDDGSTINGLILMVIKSRVDGFSQRDAIRHTWGDRCWMQRSQNRLKLVFVVGRSAAPDSYRMEHLLRGEADKYGDIVQYNFLDSYRLLVYKIIAGLSFTRQYCSFFRFIFLGDEDIVLNPIKLMKFASAIPPAEYDSFIGGHLLQNTHPMRDRRRKHYMPYNEFPEAVFPPYTAGPATLMAMPVAMRILQELMWMPAFVAWDDLAVGFALHRAGIVPKHIPSIRMRSNIYKRIPFKNLMAFHRSTSPQELRRLWVAFNMSLMC